jgi:protein-disulfide isomerase
LAVAASAVAAAAALIGASTLFGRQSERPHATAARTALLAGIPQQGLALGSPNAPVTLVEFADLQCPYCAAFARDALPAIVDDYVRTGRVRMVFAGLAFVGVDSDTALRAVIAASLQQRGWDMLDALYRSQGAENTGWVTASLVRDLASKIPNLDVERMLRDANGRAVDA